MNDRVTPSTPTTTNQAHHDTEHSSEGTTARSPMEDEVVDALRDMRFDRPMTQTPMLSFDQFQDLLTCVTESLKTKKEDNPLNMARLESYISNGLSFKFDGNENKLVPVKNRRDPLSLK
jgi:hypothetical protein